MAVGNDVCMIHDFEGELYEYDFEGEIAAADDD